MLEETKKEKGVGHVFFIVGILVCVLGSSFSFSLAAEKPYPTKPITLIIAYAPGGASDLGGRFMASKFEEFLGESLVILNKPGGGGSLAASYVAKAKPDGYTVFLMLSHMLALPTMEYTLEDYRLVGIYGKAPYFWAVKADSKWKDLKEFIDAAREKPGNLTYGTGGVDTPGHFVGQLLERHAGIKLTHIPFKSCGKAWTALLGGHISAYSCVGIGEVKTSPLARVLATSDKEKVGDIPSMGKFGVPVYYSVYYTFAFPKDTPDQVLDKWVEAQRKVFEKYQQEVSQGLTRLNLYPSLTDPAETYKEFERQTDLIKELMGK